jgi:NodT family efflux transporter outer membrane factor (OMF) lipoprotein
MHTWNRRSRALRKQDTANSAPTTAYDPDRRGRKAGWIATIAMAAPLLAAGCAVGPDFRRPPPPTVSALTPTPLPAAGEKRPAGQTFVQSLDIPQRWWELFHCTELNALVTRAIDANPDLDAARAAVRVAVANTRAAQGSFFPQIGTSLQSSSQKLSAAQAQAAGTTTAPYSLSSGQLTVSYMPDVFGLNRRQVESLAAQAEAQRFELEAAYLTLTSKLALAAIEEASLRDQIAAAEISIHVGQDVLTVLKKQRDAKEATRIDVASQEVTVSQFEQRLHELHKQLATNRDLMIALTGSLAGEGMREKLHFRCLHLPTELPLSLPSSVVRKRPDVRAAESNMHAATADIGVAIANRLPQFNLTANAGASASTIAKIAGGVSPFLFWSVLGSAALTLFDGMTSEQKQRAAEAGLDRSAALYRSTVVAAFQNVADVLQTIEVDRRQFLAAEAGAKAAQVNLHLTRQLLDMRQVSALQVLSAQQMFAQARSSYAQAKAARRADTVMLFQALGGGGYPSGDGAKGWAATVAKANDGSP